MYKAFALSFLVARILSYTRKKVFSWCSLNLGRLSFYLATRALVPCKVGFILSFYLATRAILLVKPGFYSIIESCKGSHSY